MEKKSVTFVCDQNWHLRAGTQIANSDEDLLWGAAGNFINYCSNDLIK